MVNSILALGVVGLILIVSEFLVRKKILQGESARKFVHIVAGTFIASWAFFLDVRQIQILSGVLFVGVLVSKLLNIFGSVHGVVRKTWGELFFALSIGLTITFAQSSWVYTAAILHMSLADGLAAVIGTKFGKRTSYTVFGQYKTLVGTVTFYIVSAVIIGWLVLFSPADVSNQAWLAIVWIPLLASVTENVAAGGFDNIAVPMVVIGAVQMISQIYI